MLGINRAIEKHQEQKRNEAKARESELQKKKHYFFLNQGDPQTKCVFCNEEAPEAPFEYTIPLMQLLYMPE